MKVGTRLKVRGRNVRVMRFDRARSYIYVAAATDVVATRITLEEIRRDTPGWRPQQNHMDVIMPLMRTLRNLGV